MKKYLIIFLASITSIVSGQTFFGKNNYVVVAAEDTNVYFLTSKQAVVTNANETGNLAYELDSVQIFDAVDEYNLSFPELPSTGTVTRGEVYMYVGEVVRVMQTHNRATVAHYNPHDVPALYLFRPVGGCPDWVQPQGAHDAYNIGDCVTFNGHTYESKINANVWSPSVYPAGWTLIN